MPIHVHAHLHYGATRPCDVLLQVEALQDDQQRCLSQSLTVTPKVASRGVADEDGVGTRRWMTVDRDFLCDYRAIFAVDRVAPSLADLAIVPVTQLPEALTKYLMPSRYCHSDVFFGGLPEAFAALSGGALVAEIRGWIQANFRYDIYASHPGTTATESFAARAGVCRDYAHVLISMVRAAGIPARYVSVYAPDVIPQDFHAVAEVYLEGAWHLVDATGMSAPGDIIRIGVGRDAADVSFLTSYGFLALKTQTVRVWRSDEMQPD